MSRIGNRILIIPEHTTVLLEAQNKLTVTGPKGVDVKYLPQAIAININQEKQTITTIRATDHKKDKQLHGTTNSLINGMIIGVTKGYCKELEINGVGYRANVQGETLNLSLGYSHPIKYEIDPNVKITVPKPTQLQISGFNKELVGKVAAQIRDFRPPEPYKGKGVKYKNEIIRRKEGKASGKGK